MPGELSGQVTPALPGWSSVRTPRPPPQTGRLLAVTSTVYILVIERLSIRTPANAARRGLLAGKDSLNVERAWLRSDSLAVLFRDRSGFDSAQVALLSLRLQPNSPVSGVFTAARQDEWDATTSEADSTWRSATARPGSENSSSFPTCVSIFVKSIPRTKSEHAHISVLSFAG